MPDIAGGSAVKEDVAESIRSFGRLRDREGRQAPVRGCDQFAKTPAVERPFGRELGGEEGRVESEQHTCCQAPAHLVTHVLLLLSFRSR